MTNTTKLLFTTLISTLFASQAFASQDIPVLCYHRFGPTKADSMTVTNQNFESHMKWLKDNKYNVITLQKAEDYLTGKTKSVPSNPVVITVDDGHKTVLSDMFPILKKYNYPATMFIYPSAISNAKYAMTWDNLKMLEGTKLFNVGSHMLWHPNFKQEKKKLSKEEYLAFVDNQMVKSKSKLENKMGHPVTHMAWPFGIFDNELQQHALKAGYTTSLTIERKPANKKEFMMAQPRYMIVNNDTVERFAAIMKTTSKNPSSAPADNSGYKQ